MIVYNVLYWQQRNMKKFKEHIKEEVRLGKLITAAHQGKYVLSDDDIKQIAQYGTASIAYAMSILKAPFPEGEEAMKNVGGHTYAYYAMWCVEMKMAAEHGVDTWGRTVSIVS